MHYRPYEPGDFDALYAIEEACFQPPFRYSRRHVRQLIDAESSATWIAQAKDAIAGFAIVEWARGDAGIGAYIPTIEVAPQFRKQGIGDELMRLMEASARAAGAQEIRLHVALENTAAMRLYERHGYVCLGTKEHFYAPDRGAHVYGKRLISAGPPSA
ncbi:MAG TPA: N-acetyltransferase [Terracidiphilus sp.]|nr:N-acetyltransferase [Terracidiphilus sp.]